MDFDALLDRLLGDLFPPLVLGLASAFVYLAVLARAHERRRALVAVAAECRRLRLAEEDFARRVGFSSRLARYRRLEAELARRLGS